MPLQLVEAVRQRQAVIVAGPGLGTEGGVFPRSFFQEIAATLGLGKDTSLTFPDLMTSFCERPEGRQKLLKAIRDRLNYAKGYPELYKKAAAFHIELEMISHLETIITTNWDTFFEEECGAIPFASAADFALWNLPGRKVFKLHGSANSPGSIVATRRDYSERYDRLASGDMGTALRAALAGKTLVYLGWSFADSNFATVHTLLTQGSVRPASPSYFVTVDRDAHEKISQQKDLVTIPTSYLVFPASLKEHLVAEGELLADEIFSDLDGISSEVVEHHIRFTSDIRYERHPTGILTGCYQDGLIHALHHIELTQRFGRYSSPASIRSEIESYSQLRVKHLERRHYMDVAYIDGYKNGLSLLLGTKADRKSPPAFYVYGAERQPRSARECKKMLDRSQDFDRDAYDECVNLVKRYGLDVNRIHLHHGPFLYL